jgi:hypothetical protein
MARGNGRLRARFHHAFFEREVGDETLKQIGEEIGLTQQSLHNHMKKHARRKNVNIEEGKKIKQIETIKANVAKKVELAIDHDEVVPQTDFEQAVGDIIALGIERLKKGDINVSTTQLLAAAKIKADYTAKKRGQDTELIKTMYRMASGYQGQETDSAPAVATVDSARADRPDSVHQQSAWDALTRRAEALSTGDTPA